MYTLVIGIEFKKYKNPANISLSANNKFIDTFDLDKDYSANNITMPMIESKWYEAFKKTHWLNSLEWKELWSTMPTPKLFKIYQISEEHLYDDLSGNGVIEIKVKNSNSDFTNGFMKNSSKIKFNQLALFPSHMSENKGEKLMKTIVRINDAIWKNGGRLDERSAKRQFWPCASSFTVERENEVYEKNGLKDIFTWIGGSFTAKIPIKKKFKMLYLFSEDRDTKGFWSWPTPEMLCVTSFKPLLNIYNEDK